MTIAGHKLLSWCKFSTWKRVIGVLFLLQFPLQISAAHKISAPGKSFSRSLCGVTTLKAIENTIGNVCSRTVMIIILASTVGGGGGGGIIPWCDPYDEMLPDVNETFSTWKIQWIILSRTLNLVLLLSSFQGNFQQQNSKFLKRCLRKYKLNCCVSTTS